MLFLTASASPATVQPPIAWNRWWRTPIAHVEHDATSLVTSWSDAWLSERRNATGRMVVSLTYAGANERDAIRAAQLIARTATSFDVDTPAGVRTMSVNPAVAVLHDARAGAWWLGVLTTSARSHGTWVRVPQSIDGDAFEGDAPLLRGSTVRSATRALIAVVGRDSVIRPDTWTDRPAESHR